MSTPPPTGPADASASPGPAAHAIPVRPLAAWALVALGATLVIFGILAWIFPPLDSSLVDRLRYPDFTSLTIMLAPILAVLIATRAGPPIAHARPISLIALAVYLAALLFGALALLLTLGGRFDVGDQNTFHAFGAVLQAFGGIIVELLKLALLALAALWVYQTFSRLGGRFPHFDINT